MTPRQQLQMAYELAFHPARLNAAWNEWEKGTIADLALLRQVLDWALTLHQRLPEAPAASGRALRRLARYQATARLYRLPSMVRAFRARLGGTGEIPEEVLAWMVRDIGLPIFGRERQTSTSRA
jgi:hypothetical protein